MRTTTERQLDEVLRLSEHERTCLAARLINSLDPQKDADAAEEWDAEIHRRIAELESRAVKPIPWSEVRRTVLGLK